jgi:hypothetical protein
MPQLDLMTFFTQFFWFSIGFSFFYIFLLHYIMPAIALTLKFRKKKIELLAIDINNKKESASSLLTTYDTVLSKSLVFSRNFIIKVGNYGNSWLNSSMSDINLVNLAKVNQTYIRTVSEKDFSFLFLDIYFKNDSKDLYWSKIWMNKKV